jgi:uncharacterized protein (DUF342 family)
LVFAQHETEVPALGIHQKGKAMEHLKTAVQGLSFSVIEATGELHANFLPAPGASPPDMAALQQALQQSGHSNFHLIDNGLADFVAKAQVTEGELSMLIGKRRDAEFRIDLGDDLMSAHLTLRRPEGGQPLPPSAILDDLHKKDIVFGILTEKIEAALAAGECENLTIACGIEPVAGTPGGFENLLIKKEEQLSELDENAIVHYNDLSHLLLVKKGDPLLRRIPSVPSKDGTNIKGHVVAATAVPEIDFAEANEGAEPDPKDADLLVAKCAGQPVITRNGAVVHSVLEVENVCLKTGNIVFEGTIKVKGDIEAGMHVKVRGDVIVLGMVETAQINAGGNVAVQGGVVGHANSHPGAHGLPPDAAQIECGGSVQARFIENVRIKAGDTIQIDAQAHNCELFARNQVIVGKPGARNSHLAGGTTHATQLIKVLNLGSPNGIKTMIEVGSDPDLVQEMTAQNAKLQHTMDELEHTQKLIAHFEKNPQKNVGGISEKLAATRKHLAATIFAMLEEKAALAAKLELSQQAKIEVAESLFDGVEIRIGKHVLHVNDERSGGTIHLVGEEIVID